MSRNIKPLGSLILVKPITSVEQELDGLVMPTTSLDEGLKRAEVVDVGDKDIPDTLKSGTIVIVPPALRNEIKINGVKHNLLHIEEILAIETTL
jgi:co-chaperonin GroES (HSP10)